MSDPLVSHVSDLKKALDEAECIPGTVEVRKKLKKKAVKVKESNAVDVSRPIVSKYVDHSIQSAFNASESSVDETCRYGCYSPDVSLGVRSCPEEDKPIFRTSSGTFRASLRIRKLVPSSDGMTDGLTMLGGGSLTGGLRLVESDSFTDTLHTPNCRPHRKKRLVKRMAIGDIAPVAHEKKSYCHAMEIDATPTVSPDSSLFALGISPMAHFACSPSTSTSGAAVTCFNGKRSSNTTTYLLNGVDNNNMKQATASRNGLRRGHTFSECSSSMEYDCCSRSSLSSSETELYANDEDREADDEQSDWFFESTRATSPQFFNSISSINGGGCGTSQQRIKRKASPIDECMGVPPVNRPLLSCCPISREWKKNASADSGSSTATQQQTPCNSHSVPDSSDTDMSQYSWPCPGFNAITNSNSLVAKNSINRRTAAKSSRAAFISAVSRKVARFMDDVHQHELVFGSLKKREQIEIVKLAGLHHLEVRYKSGRRRHGLTLVKAKPKTSVFTASKPLC